MSIQSIGMNSAPPQIQDQVGVSMLSKTLKGTQEEAAEQLQSLGTKAPLAEGSGSLVDTEA